VSVLHTILWIQQVHIIKEEKNVFHYFDKVY